MHIFDTQVLIKQNSTSIFDKIAMTMELSTPNCHKWIDTINKEAKMMYTYKFILIKIKVNYEDIFEW